MAAPDYAFIDGFDHYTEVGDRTVDISSLMFMEWTGKENGNGSYFATAALTGPSTGCSLEISGNQDQNNTIYKVFPANYARSIGGVLFQLISTANPTAFYPGVTFRDGSSAQFSITINPFTGAIQARRGDTNGTVIATSTEVMNLANANHIAWDITFHNSTGIIKVWLNGVLTTLNLTGQDTCNTANNYFNGFAMGYAAGSNNGSYRQRYDHLHVYCYTASGGSEVPGLQAMIGTDFVDADSSPVQFNIGPGVLGKDYRTTTSTNTPGANQLVLMPQTYPVNATLDNVKLVPNATSAVAKFKAVLYADNGSGLPGALVATGTEVVGCTSGTTLTLPFSSGQALTGGTQYWIGYITDTSIDIRRQNSTGSLGQRKANTYTSGAPNPAGTMITGPHPDYLIWGTLSSVASHYATVGRRQASTLSYNYDTTVGDEDMLEISDLAVTPSAIYMVAYKMAVNKADSGTRLFDIKIDSGATISVGSASNFSPSIGNSYFTTNFFVDPDTSVTWTTSGVNAATVAYEIDS